MSNKAQPCSARHTQAFCCSVTSKEWWWLVHVPVAPPPPPRPVLYLFFIPPVLHHYASLSLVCIPVGSPPPRSLDTNLCSCLSLHCRHPEPVYSTVNKLCDKAPSPRHYSPVECDKSLLHSAPLPNYHLGLFPDSDIHRYFPPPPLCTPPLCPIPSNHVDGMPYSHIFSWIRLLAPTFKPLATPSFWTSFKSSLSLSLSLSLSSLSLSPSSSILWSYCMVFFLNIFTFNQSLVCSTDRGTQCQSQKNYNGV